MDQSVTSETCSFLDSYLCHDIANDVAVFHNVPDVSNELCLDELSQFEGIQCVKTEQNKFFFEFLRVSNSTNNQYTIEILIDENGHGQLNGYYLPPIPVEKIFSLHPIYNTNNIKYFLHTCKSYIDSYLCRKKQVEDLKVIKKASLA